MPESKLEKFLPQTEIELLLRQIDELREQNHRLEQRLSEQADADHSSQQILNDLTQVDRVIQQSADLESLMEELLQTTLAIFGSDRAWLLYPCDPTAASWQVLMECTRPAYPGALSLKTDLPMTAESQAVFQRALSSKGPVRYDTNHPHPLPAESAEKFSIQAQITLAIYPHTGKPWLFGMHQCSHARVWTDAECRLLEQIGQRLPHGFDTFLTSRQLEESEQKFRSLVANIPGVIYRRQGDEPLTMNYLSEAIKTLSGYPASDFINNYIRSYASIIVPEDRQLLSAQVQEAISRQESFELEYRLKHRNGKTVWVYERGRAILDSAGKVQYLDGAIFDISYSKEAKDEIERLEKALIQSDKVHSLGTLAAGMAHELNNPLAGILQNLQVLKSRLSDTTEKNCQVAAATGNDWRSIGRYVEERQLNRLIDAAVASGQRAAQIVRNLLSFSRSGKMTLQLCAAADILEQALELATTSFDLKTGCDFRKIAIERDYPADLPKVPCDPSQLQQVFLNLLQNAAQACADKSQQLSAAEQQDYLPTISLRLGLTADRLQISISDNGIGIDEAAQSRLFDPFYTTREPGVGTGLGLSICHYIIHKNHHGSLRAESSPGCGSRIIVELPLKQPSC